MFFPVEWQESTSGAVHALRHLEAFLPRGALEALINVPNVRIAEFRARATRLDHAAAPEPARAPGGRLTGASRYRSQLQPGDASV
jgi:hypothetical protein